jgi:elongation factor Tu
MVGMKGVEPEFLGIARISRGDPKLTWIWGREGHLFGLAFLLGLGMGCLNDSTAPGSTRPFLMPIQDVFSIRGRGTVVLGTILRGAVCVGQELEIVGMADVPVPTRALAIDKFRQNNLRSADSGEVGILLEGVDYKGVRQGMVIAARGTIHACRSFEARIEPNPGEPESGPLALEDSASLSFSIWGVEIPGRITIAGSGGSGEATIALSRQVALEAGMKLPVRVGPRSVGVAVVLRVLDR